MWSSDWWTEMGKRCPDRRFEGTDCCAHRGARIAVPLRPEWTKWTRFSTVTLQAANTYMSVILPKDAVRFTESGAECGHDVFVLDGAINHNRGKFEQRAATIYDLRFHKQQNNDVVG